MQEKKHSSKNLEREKSIGFLIGFVFALSFLYIIFEWSSYKVTVHDAIDNGEYIPIEILDMPITKEKKEQPVPIPPRTPKIIETIIIMDNEKEVEGIDFTSDNFDAPIQILPPVPIKKDTDDIIVDFLPQEFMPRFQGDLEQFLADNVKYPSLAMQNGIQGKVISQFIVNKDGTIENIAIIRGVDPALDKEVLRVIGLMPNWKPGTQHGKPVRVRFTLPVAFRLEK